MIFSNADEGGTLQMFSFFKISSGFFGLNNLLESSAFTHKWMTEVGLGEKIMCLYLCV